MSPTSTDEISLICISCYFHISDKKYKFDWILICNVFSLYIFQISCDIYPDLEELKNWNILLWQHTSGYTTFSINYYFIKTKNLFLRRKPSVLKYINDNDGNHTNGRITCAKNRCSFFITSFSAYYYYRES